MTIDENKAPVFSPEAKAAIVDVFDTIQSLFEQSGAKDYPDLLNLLEMTWELIQDFYDEFPEIESFLFGPVSPATGPTAPGQISP